MKLKCNINIEYSGSSPDHNMDTLTNAQLYYRTTWCNNLYPITNYAYIKEGLLYVRNIDIPLICLYVNMYLTFWQ